MRDLIFTIPFISLFQIASVDQKNFFRLAASVTYIAAVNPNGIKTLLTNGFSTFLIKSKPVFINGPRILAKNPPNFLIVDNQSFNNFILDDEPFAKALLNAETFALVDNNLYGK